MNPEEAAAKPTPPSRESFAAFRTLATRWSDNDVYGHVNNVVYYAWFDTAVNAHLIDAGALDPQAGAAIGLVVETHCNYFAPLSFPEPVEVGLRVATLGRSSVRYELAVFAIGAETAAASGHFVHVYVDRETRRPVPLAEALRRTLETLQR